MTLTNADTCNASGFHYIYSFMKYTFLDKRASCLLNPDNAVIIHVVAFTVWHKETK